MPKYIDLLREHQKHKSSVEPLDTLVDESTELNEHAVQDISTQNPYSKPEKTSESGEELLYTSTNLDVTTQTQEISLHDLPEDAPVTEITHETQHSHPHTDQPTNTVDDITSTPTKLTDDNEPEPSPASFDTALWLRQMSLDLKTIFQAIADNQPMQLDLLTHPLEYIIRKSEDSPSFLDTLELETIHHSYLENDETHDFTDLIEKSIHLMLYAIKLGLHLKLPCHTTIQCTVAIMLHHLGMVLVPCEIRLKVGKLTRSERKQIEQAPALAMEYLETHPLSRTITLQDNHIITHEELLIAVAQSKEHFDGSQGEGLSGLDIALIARIAHLLTTYESLTHHRPHRERLMPRDAIRELITHHKKTFDPALLKTWIEITSLYPIGIFVQLNTGELGQVILVHKHSPLRPLVHITMDKHGHTIEPREIDLSKHPNLMIKKSMYEDELQDMLGKDK